jgi:hypothetical protein
LYIIDIADNTQSFSRLFADDTSLLYSSNNINEIEVIVNSDLSKIYNWSKEATKYFEFSECTKIVSLNYILIIFDILLLKCVYFNFYLTSSFLMDE